MPDIGVQQYHHKLKVFTGHYLIRHKQKAHMNKKWLCFDKRAMKLKKRIAQLV